MMHDVRASAPPLTTMDSQLTPVVNPSELPGRQAHIKLVFDRDSLTNANLLVKDVRR